MLNTDKVTQYGVKDGVTPFWDQNLWLILLIEKNLNIHSKILYLPFTINNVQKSVVKNCSPNKTKCSLVRASILKLDGVNRVGKHHLLVTPNPCANKLNTVPITKDGFRLGSYGK